MSKRNQNTQSLNKFRKATFVLLLVIIICIALYVLLNTQNQSVYTPADGNGSSRLEVAVLDVGQGDCILVVFDTGETMLIDASTKSSAETILNKLDSRGIKEIDILVATHPHADHIGGMEDVVRNYDIGCVYMPDMKSSSKTYKQLISAINEKDIPIIEGYAGLDFSFGPSVCTIVSPQEDANKDANNESIVIFLDYGETDFLFTGDIEAWGEEAILSEGYTIDADVLKVAHHGSRGSTTEEFLSAVSPEYAVISCGTGNTYGHPHDEALELLSRHGIETYRTDIIGDVVFYADGHELSLADAG